MPVYRRMELIGCPGCASMPGLVAWLLGEVRRPKKEKSSSTGPGDIGVHGGLPENLLKVALVRRGHGGWCFPLCALDDQTTCLKILPVFRLALIKRRSRLVLHDHAAAIRDAEIACAFGGVHQVFPGQIVVAGVMAAWMLTPYPKNYRV